MINYAAREINCKIVYYGPGLGGKTTNLEHIYGKVKPDTRGKLISLATETERTLFFDFLPVDLGTIRGFNTRSFLRSGFRQDTVTDVVNVDRQEIARGPQSLLYGIAALGGSLEILLEAEPDAIEQRVPCGLGNLGEEVGFTVEDVLIGVGLVIRTSAPGYAPQELVITPMQSPVSEVLVTLSRMPELRSRGR